MTKEERLLKRDQQIKINNECESFYDAAVTEYQEQGASNIERLRYCSAEVIETENYYLLRSYSTIVAIIPKLEAKLYDCLRQVYGYTATSAQHISKFRADYIYYKLLTWECEIYTWREVK